MRNSYASLDRPTIRRVSKEIVPECRVCRTVLPPDARWCVKCGLNTMSHVHGKLASPGRRLAATAIDYVIPIGAVVATWSMADGAIILELVLLAYAAWALVLFTSGTTLGKQLVHIRVIHIDGMPATLGRMVAREWFGKWLSASICGIGYLGIVIDRERRAMHDRVLHTYVVE
jgi:uncharacterized RDD family membrane protein YckC